MREERPGARLSREQAAFADRGLKALIPVHGRPFFSYLVSNLADAGFREAVVVVGPATEAVRVHYEQDPPRRLRMTFAWQAEPLGSADALVAAEPHTGLDPFLVLNADNLYPVPLLRAMEARPGPAFAGYTREGLAAWGNIPTERIAAFALVTVDARGCLDSIVEKPDPGTAARLEGRSRISMNCWRFPQAIYDACRRVAPSSRGERELTDAVRVAAEDGMCLSMVPTDAGALDLSRREDVAAAARWLDPAECRP